MQAALEALLAKASHGITLSQIAQAVGEGASPAEIEAVIEHLEGAGVSIREPTPIDHQARLKRVLGSARELKAAGKSASPSAIAAQLEIPEHEVRATLLYARTLNG